MGLVTVLQGQSVTKEHSRQLAVSLFPELGSTEVQPKRGGLTLKKHHGRADALLISCFG